VKFWWTYFGFPEDGVIHQLINLLFLLVESSQHLSNFVGFIWFWSNFEFLRDNVMTVDLTICRRWWAISVCYIFWSYWEWSLGLLYHQLTNWSLRLRFFVMTSLYLVVRIFIIRVRRLNLLSVILGWILFRSVYELLIGIHV
jgi:hypothetical protein